MPLSVELTPGLAIGTAIGVDIPPLGQLSRRQRVLSLGISIGSTSRAMAAVIVETVAGSSVVFTVFKNMT